MVQEFNQRKQAILTSVQRHKDDVDYVPLPQITQTVYVEKEHEIIDSKRITTRAPLITSIRSQAEPKYQEFVSFVKENQT